VRDCLTVRSCLSWNKHERQTADVCADIVSRLSSITPRLRTVSSNGTDDAASCRCDAVSLIICCLCVFCYWLSKSVFCPSVCPLRSGIRWKRLNISSQFFHRAVNISQTATDTAIVTIEGETAPKLLNGTSFNDLERPLSQISRSRYYSTCNLQMVQDRAIVTTAN